jgi:multidrug/hemolysin transport system ATP-binding protein
MENIIEIEALKKSFGEVKAVDGLSFKVKEGELFAFLGVNGAGKSTTINIICGNLTKDTGKVSVNGIDLDTGSDGIKTAIGVVFQGSYLDAPLTVLDNLKSRAALYGNVGDAFDKRLGELSRMLDLDKLLKRSYL